MSTSSPGPAAKRRKTASSALFKPFKSPLRTPLKTLSPTDHINTPQNGTTTTPAPSFLISSFPSTAAHTIPPTTPNPIYLPSSPSSLPSPPSQSLSTLQRHHTSLLAKLTALRSTLDTHTQALKIESLSKDTELTRLIDLWRAASRQAAEEIFGGVRDRVNRMGGVGAWREREREGRSRWGDSGGWNDGPVIKTDGGGSGSEDEEGVEEKRERLGAEAEAGGNRQGYGREEWGAGSRSEDGEDRDEEGFTMDMMLKSLNIELDVIGYDKEMQRWIE